MKTALIISLLVLSASICNAQSGVGLSLSSMQMNTKKYKLNHRSTVGTYQHYSKGLHSEFEYSSSENYIKSLKALNIVRDFKMSAKEKYSMVPKLMINYALDAKSQTWRLTSEFEDYGQELDRFNYPINDYDGFGSLLLLIFEGLNK